MISSSSSNWLDRLRSSRGFPSGSELDLDRFLSSSSSGSVPTTESATHSESTQSNPPILRREKIIISPHPLEWAPPVSGLLSDLFNMGVGETSRTFSKKSSRKQPNPRFFCGGPSSETELPSSSDDLRREKNLNLNQNQNQSSGDNSLNERLENCNNNVIRVDELKKVENNNGGEEEEDVDLKKYSRNEVTVIDTSCEEWKSDKWVFRKNDEWKIREKKSKCKSRVFAGKKRKLLVSNLGDKKLHDVDDDDVDELKMKKKGDEILLQLNKGQHQNENEKEKEPNQEREDILGKVPQKRFPCPRPPKKFINEGSPVILLKSIPSSNTNAAIKPCKSFQKKRPKKMKIV